MSIPQFHLVSDAQTNMLVDVDGPILRNFFFNFLYFPNMLQRVCVSFGIKKKINSV